MEANQLNLSDASGIMITNEPDEADDNNNDKPSRKRRSRSERKRSSRHRSEHSIDDKTMRSSMSRSSHSSSRSSKKMERTNSEVLHWQGDKSEDAAAISTPEIIHSKSKRSRQHRHRASSRSFDEGPSPSTRRSQSTDSTGSLTEHSSHSRKKPHRRAMHSFSHGSTKSLKDESSKKSRRKDTMHSSYHGPTKSLKDDESSNKSKRKGKHKSHHRQSSRERFDLITVPSKTSSKMEVGGQERKITRNSQNAESIESFTECSSHSRKKPHQRAMHSSSTHGSTNHLEDESSNKSKRKDKGKNCPRQSSRERFDLIPTVPSRTTSTMEVGGQKRGNKRRNSHEQTLGRGRSTLSSRKSAPPKIAVIDFEGRPRERRSFEGRMNDRGFSSDRSLGHSNRSSHHESFRRSKRIPITPRIADASNPPGPSSYSSSRHGKEQHMKQMAANSNSNGRGRSPSPEESLATRPGAQAVSLDGEEFRNAVDSRLLASQPAVTDISDQGDEHHETASTTTSLQATIVDGESHPEVEAIKAENERLRRSMIAENQRQRQRIENHRHSHTAQHHQTEDLSTLGEIIEAFPEEENDDTAGEEKQRRQWLLCALLSCLFLAIGGVFGPNLIANFSSSKYIPTSTPTSSSPSSPPSITMLYDPPSEEDCLAIENGEPVSDQDTTIVVTLDVGLEIILNKEIARNEWMDQLLQSIFVHLIPYLVGCTDDTAPSLGNRYIFGNGNATIDYDDAETCERETDLPCYPVAVHLDLTVKDDEETSTLINLLETLMGPTDGSGDSLADRLDLSDDFNGVVLGNITHMSPVPLPSSSPTDLPSSYPSAVPSAFPSMSTSTPLPSLVLFTEPTIASPSANPSSMPTDFPSHSPSKSPNEAPSTVPIGFPGKTPAGTESVSPSALPSLRPTTVPSTPPTSVPSVSPTTTPSAEPSASTSVPSSKPSSSPTTSTTAPSSKPSSSPTTSTTAPSSKPSSLPTDPPSKSPTAIPRVQPLLGDFYWVACGRSTFFACNKKRPMVQNADYSTIGGIPAKKLSDEIAVRCCSDNKLGGFFQKIEYCPYADSAIGGVCYNTTTFYEAENVCSNVGARLCTLAEIQNDCAAGTGCDHNKRMTWTSTPGPMGATSAPIPKPTKAPTT